MNSAASPDRQDPTVAQDSLALTCDEVEALLPLVADGSLDEVSDPALFTHIARCCPCQDSLARHDLVGLALEHGLEQAAGAATDVATKDRHIRFAPALASACAAGLALAVAGGWYAEERSHEIRLRGQVAAMPVSNPVADSGTLWNEPKTVLFSPDAPGAAIPDLPRSYADNLSANRPTAVAFDPTATPAGTSIYPRHFIIIHTGQGPDQLLVAPDGMGGQRLPGPTRMAMPVTYQRY